MLLDQMTGSWILVSSMLAATDPYNAQPGGMTPLVVGLAAATVGLSYGANAGGAINPARDFSPRCMAGIIFGREAFRYVIQYNLYSITYTTSIIEHKLKKLFSVGQQIFSIQNISFGYHLLDRLLVGFSVSLMIINVLEISA